MITKSIWNKYGGESITCEQWLALGGDESKTAPLYFPGAWEAQQGGPNIYSEISNFFAEQKRDYMAAENVGFNALFDITGHYSVHRGKDGKYFFSASSAGSTPASSQGTVEFQGSAVLMVNGKAVSQIPFVNHGDGINPIFPKGFSRIGSLSLQLPTSGTVMINLQFSYHIQFGSAGERHSSTLTVPVYIRTIGFPRN